MGRESYGQVTIGTVTLNNICPDGSYNPIPANYFGGSVQFYIEENNPGEIQGTNSTDRILKLAAPAGFEFRPGVGSINYDVTGDMSNAVINVTASEITVTVSYAATGNVNNDIDYLDFNNIEVRTITGNSSGDIVRTGATTYNIIGFPDGTSIASLSSTELISFTSPPENTTVCESSLASFSVGASGGTLNYQWQENDGTGFVNILNGGIYSGVNSATLNISSAAASMNGYSYRVVVDNDYCFETSADALLNVDSAPATINTNPTNKIICKNDNTSFSVAASGDGLSYQWRENGVILADGGIYSGATTATLILTNVPSTENGNSYDVVVSATCGLDVTSTSATLTINERPEIVTQPSSSTICENPGNTSFTVDAGVTSSPTYQWQESTDGGITYSNLSDAGIYLGTTTATLNLTGTTPTEDGNLYKVIVSGACTPSVTSDPAILTVEEEANITANPTNATACEGSNVSFSLTAQGADLQYQWQLSTDNGVSFGNLTNTVLYSGATTATLTLTGISSTENSYQYRALVSNGAASPCNAVATSTAATLTVDEKPEITTQPTSSTICEAGSTSFVVNAGATTLPTYQWQLSTDGGLNYSDL
ncbi:immunoglobulin domain-containing protein, partial [Marivirga sp.]|uniref:immunoglobulin domain-containing protein n=1 Tax=Marivirga sp. TaxID=2018662 RepID=UPI00345D9B0D